MSPIGLWGGREVRSITPDDIRTFLAVVTEGLKRSTKRHIREKAFPMMNGSFRAGTQPSVKWSENREEGRHLLGIGVGPRYGFKITALT